MSIKENYNKRAQLLTKEYKVGCTRQVSHLLLKELLFRFGNQLFFYQNLAPRRPNVTIERA